MSIHAHKAKRMIKEMNSMIKSIEALNNWIDKFGYNELDNMDKKFYAMQSLKIRKMNNKINKIIYN